MLLRRELQRAESLAWVQPRRRDKERGTEESRISEGDGPSRMKAKQFKEDRRIIRHGMDDSSLCSSPRAVLSRSDGTPRCAPRRIPLRSQAEGPKFVSWIVSYGLRATEMLDPGPVRRLLRFRTRFYHSFSMRFFKLLKTRQSCNEHRRKYISLGRCQTEITIKAFRVRLYLISSISLLEWWSAKKPS